jgi:hypothetical protein
MPRPDMSKNAPFFFIREGVKLIQCNKNDFDKAVREGKSIWYRGYANKSAEKIAAQLEISRMKILAMPDLPPKLREVLLDPVNVVEVEIIRVDDPLFWEKEAKLPKYQK